MTRRWTKITLDNAEQVYELDENGPVMFACVDDDAVIHYGTWQSFGLTINTMAKSDGRYYYYPLPILYKNSLNTDSEILKDINKNRILNKIQQ